MMTERQAMERSWSAEEQRRWRLGVTHEFPYQRYKTIQDIRDRRLAGSEEVLWDGLQDENSGRVCGP